VLKFVAHILRFSSHTISRVRRLRSTNPIEIRGRVTERRGAYAGMDSAETHVSMYTTPLRVRSLVLGGQWLVAVLQPSVVSKSSEGAGTTQLVGKRTLARDCRLNGNRVLSMSPMPAIFLRMTLFGQGRSCVAAWCVGCCTVVDGVQPISQSAGAAADCAGRKPTVLTVGIGWPGPVFGPPRGLTVDQPGSEHGRRPSGVTSESRERVSGD